MRYTFIKNCRDDEKLRESFNRLTKKTFGFNFKEYYARGFWGDKYIPYSLADGDRIIANVSVNLMDFKLDGIDKHYIQIGTVMTDAEYRAQGLSRCLMERVLEEYKDAVDGIYLFGNDKVLDFYPKFGFKKSKEYQYSKNILSDTNISTVQVVHTYDKASWEEFFSTVKNSVANDRFTMFNADLLAFWTMNSKSVYYLPKEKAYAVARVNEQELVLYQVIAKRRVELQKVISSFGKGINKVTLGFTPYKEENFQVEEYHEEDCTLFVLGKDLDEVEQKKLRFPVLSHA